jgi:dihydrofolate reductase
MGIWRLIAHHDDPHGAIEEMSVVHHEMRSAAKEKNIWIVGGGDLAGQFYDAALLDELIVQIGSATLGSGKPLFPRRVLSPTLRLMSVNQMSTGMVELRYEINRKGGVVS